MAAAGAREVSVSVRITAHLSCLGKAEAPERFLLMVQKQKEDLLNPAVVFASGVTMMSCRTQGHGALV